MITPAARMRAKYATLLEHFHLTLPEIGKLTDRQIDELYFHPRDEQGLIHPKRKAIKVETLEDELRALEILHIQLQPFGGIQNYEETREQVKQKWQEKASVQS